MIYDSHQMLLAKLNKQPDALYLKESFAGIYLPSKQVIALEILFGMDSPGKQLVLKPGKYTFVFFVKEQSGQYKKIGERQEQIGQDVISNFGSSETVTILLPFGEREKLKSTQN